jgi:hypothetical protein
MPRPLTETQLRILLERLPAHRAFTYAEAVELGANDRLLSRLVECGWLERRLQGVYRRPEAPDTIATRLECLALVVPEDCVVTDLTAAWIWCGDRALPPNGHLSVPLLSVFAPPGRRLRNGLVDSGERGLLDSDVVRVGGVLVTTPLRTACDLGRLLHVDSAFAAMDCLASLLEFTVDQLVDELRRFKGYRGIIQARQWAPYVDPRSDSWLESVGRLRWLGAGLPRPMCQVPVPAPDARWFFVDFGLPDELFGCEVFGEEHHGEEERPHDESRLEWLREERKWVITVARNPNITGPRRDLEAMLHLAWQRHRQR